MDEVRVRAEKHIEAEESNVGKREKESRKQERIAERREPQCSRPNQRRDRGNRSRNRSTRPVTEEAYTPLNAKLSTILDNSLHDGSIRRPAPFVGTMGRNSDSCCRYHKTDGHTSNDCWTLKQQIEQLMQRGHLKKFVKETEVGEGKRQRGNPNRKQEKEARGRTRGTPGKRSSMRRMIKVLWVPLLEDSQVEEQPSLPEERMLSQSCQ